MYHLQKGSLHCSCSAMWALILTLHAMTKEHISLIFHLNITGKRADNKFLRKKTKKIEHYEFPHNILKRKTYFPPRQNFCCVSHGPHRKCVSGLHDIAPCHIMDISKQHSQTWPDCAHRYTKAHWHQYNHQNPQQVGNCPKLELLAICPPKAHLILIFQSIFHSLPLLKKKKKFKACHWSWKQSCSFLLEYNNLFNVW